MRICYSKPTIILIDDDLEILCYLKDCIEAKYKKISPILTVSNADDALALIYEFERNTYNHASDIYLELTNKCIKLSEAFFLLKKFFPIFIIDQSLGNKITGKDIIEIVDNKLLMCNVAMLTSELSYEFANELHNSSVIDAFYRKDENNLTNKILNHLSQAIKKRESFFNFDGEVENFNELNIIYDLDYRASVTKLLEKEKWYSYFILNNKGDIALSSEDNNYHIFRYKQGKFHEQQTINDK